MSDPLRIAIVEDNEVFREALELLLGLERGIEVVCSLGDGAEAVERLPVLAPDVVVVDYRLPGLDGVEATAALRVACPAAAVLALTANADPEAREALLAAGAVDCVGKDRELSEIVGAIRAAGGR
ncbi:MAG: response regulator transcription factor [Thermoleophilia bacterium]